MDRREAIKRISVMLGVAVSGTTAAGILSGCRPTDGALRVLTAGQHELLAVMTEHILPATDTPGARDAGVADFIDAMLADFATAEERTNFLGALTEVDAAATEQFGQGFMASSAEQQFGMLDAMDEAAIADPDAESSSFMRRLKEYTLAGYYTSEVGATQELQVNPMGMHRGDIPYEEVGRSWA